MKMKMKMKIRKLENQFPPAKCVRQSACEGGVGSIRQVRGNPRVGGELRRGEARRGGGVQVRRGEA